MFRVLIVEDDEKLVSLLQDYFQKYEFETSVVRRFGSVVEEFKAFSPHLVLLDINLPKFDGYYWCRQIRQFSTCPILFISARDEKMEQVMAMENGGDDFITKPFDYEIVLAKIRSQLRRSYGDYATNQLSRTINLEGVSLDVDRMVISFGADMVELSHTETRMLSEFLSKPEAVISRDRLLEKIWDEEAFVDDNTLNVNINRVRKKLQNLHIENAILTVRGKGYRLIPNWGRGE
ncbi:response regulator transcription factor [Halobacillus ihumii]|uniref:response regulator transcription factor n=1 Tax=Halobacillus ihumii TaxID=2686092 RepID=UPI0013D04632|nr:response regulator transcription factor [Halobacillus ihumii]